MADPHPEIAISRPREPSHGAASRRAASRVSFRLGALQQRAQVGAGRLTSMNRGRRTQGVEPLDPGDASGANSENTRYLAG